MNPSDLIYDWNQNHPPGLKPPGPVLLNDESLRDGWPVDGNTGYEFLNSVLALLIDPSGEAALTSQYAEFTGERLPFPVIVRECKLRVMRNEMSSELNVLAREAARVAYERPETADFTCVLYAVEQLPDLHGLHVGIIGLGSIGLLFSSTAKAAGAAKTNANRARRSAFRISPPPSPPRPPWRARARRSAAGGRRARPRRSWRSRPGRQRPNECLPHRCWIPPATVPLRAAKPALCPPP